MYDHRVLDLDTFMAPEYTRWEGSMAAIHLWRVLFRSQNSEWRAASTDYLGHM